MSSFAVDDDTRLRSALVSIAASEMSYGRWLNTDEARWMLAAIDARIAGIITTRFSRRHGIDFDSLDIVNTAVVLLADEHLVELLDAASDQWAYLYRVISNEMLNQMGTRGNAPLDMAEQVTDLDSEKDTPDVRSAMDSTIAILSPLTPAVLRPHLREVVEYLADRGHSRLSHVHTASADDKTLIDLGLERRHILALANAVLGARPNHGENSILAGFLRDADWKPAQSIPHRLALKKYGARMARESASDKKMAAAI
jgi:hypothetical protein